jgi:hypothetical protein
LVQREPRLLLASAEEQRATCERWKEMGFTDEEVCKAITRHPALLNRGSAWNVEAKVQYLKQLGLAPHGIARVLVANGGQALPSVKEKVW